jgi:hypothetical protein
MLNNSHLYHQAKHDFERRGIDGECYCVYLLAFSLPDLLSFWCHPQFAQNA